MHRTHVLKVLNMLIESFPPSCDPRPLHYKLDTLNTGLLTMFYQLYDFNLVCCAIATVSAAVGYRYTRGRSERRTGVSRYVPSNVMREFHAQVASPERLTCACPSAHCPGGATATLAKCQWTSQLSLSAKRLTARLLIALHLNR